jgi:hypothetical protein
MLDLQTLVFVSLLLSGQLMAELSEFGVTGMQLMRGVRKIIEQSNLSIFFTLVHRAHLF